MKPLDTTIQTAALKTAALKEAQLLALAALLACLPAFAAAAEAQDDPQPRFTDPRAIDRAVLEFTG